MIASEIENISAEEWEGLAAEVGRSVDEIRAALASVDESSEVSAVPLELLKKDYEFPLIPGVLSFKVSAEFTGGDDWKADVTFKILLFGEQVYSQKFIDFSKEKQVVHIKPGTALFHADVEFGFYGEHYCFGAKGHVKVVGFGKKEFDFEDVFCLS
ncbi:hypothetical protein ACFV2X_26700 [Streptomyces sp. NPDC059679]|uniref:hypothetical protein n=1 Tax=Streptomyces sp. NPDC059679 TaxID=3346903 RepID=UPI003674CE99